jgi:prolyl oligopeptidase
VQDWAFLQQYSPYHNIDPNQVRAGAYPALLMTTSTRDDRVHPYHARCFVKRLLDCGTPVVSDKKVFYYENIEGGHGGAADNKQQAYMSTLYLNFLKRVLNAE